MGFIEGVLLELAFTLFQEKHPDKAEKITEGLSNLSNDYERKKARVQSDYDNAQNRALNMSDSDLKNKYKNESNTIKKAAYAQELKKRLDK